MIDSTDIIPCTGQHFQSGPRGARFFDDFNQVLRVAPEFPDDQRVTASDWLSSSISPFKSFSTFAEMSHYGEIGVA